MRRRPLGSVSASSVNRRTGARDNKYDKSLELAIRLGSSDSRVFEPKLCRSQIREEGDPVGNLISARDCGD